MIIAVNTRQLLEQPEGYGHFLKELLEVLVRNRPDHEFYFLFDRPFQEQYVFSSNVHPVVVSPPARIPVLWKYWYDLKIPAVLKKIKAEVFVSTDGFCSLTTRVPQCLVVHDLGFLHHPEAYKPAHVRFLKRNTPRYLKKAARVLTVSRFSREDILKQYRIPPEKIEILYNGVRTVFQPVPDAEKSAIRDRYTQGQEYFVAVGAIQPRKNLINLLKAFSIFKKRLQSGMKLVIAGRLAWKHEEFSALINSYKYRSDVVLTGYLPDQELALVMGSAFGLVYPSFFEGFGLPVAEAMKCRVPVLTSQKSSMQEIAGEAALYFDPADHTDMAEKMMLLYKDEELKKELVEKGAVMADRYKWENSAEILWQNILKAAAP